MEDPATPWVIADVAVRTMSRGWAWTLLALGGAIVMVGAILFS